MKLNSRIYTAKSIGKLGRPIIVFYRTETSTNLLNHYELHKIPFGESQKMCELRSGPYILTEVITKVNYEIALDADPTRTQVVHRNHLLEGFRRDNELPNVLSIYENLLTMIKPSIL